MLDLDNKHLDKFKIPNTSIQVILDGVYRPDLSDKCNSVTFNANALEIFAQNKIQQPIHLLFLTSQSCHYNLNIIAAKDNTISLIEEHISLGNNTYTNKLNINITAENNSEIIYYKLQTENTTTTHHTQTNIKQKQNSKVTSYFIGQGTKIASNALHIELIGKNASYLAKGIIALHETQTLDYQIKIDHLAPNCTSNVLFKGIINHQAKGNFNCLVVAHPKAKHTETHVINKNLLLSESALMNTAPQLEVYVDDVICTHGATVGQLDQKAIFYFRSRGITEKQAIQLLTTAFANEITEQLPSYCQSKINLGVLL